MLNNCDYRRFSLYLIGIFISTLANADSPSRKPYEYMTCSQAANYCAVVSPQAGVSVFKITKKRENVEPVYQIPSWHPQSFLSEDGNKFIAVESTIVSEYSYDQPVVRLWIHGKLIKDYLVKDLIKSSKLVKTSSGYFWAEPVGFDGLNHFVFRSDDDSTFVVTF